MRTGVIKADTIDVATDKILVELGADSTSSRENAIYFDGWDGLGASAVLQDVARRFTISNEMATKSTGLEFQKIIHIDCSKWESRRAMQRKIAEQLKLPSRVIDMFDKQDKEDDFNGFDQDSRAELAQATRAIYQTLQNRRFLVILHNGSNEEIDILNFGLSLYGYTNSKMLWTFQGRFRLDPKMIDNVKKSTTTQVLLSASRDVRDPREIWSYLVRHEAAQVSSNKDGHDFIDRVIAAECVLYMLKQSWIGSRIVDYDWATHTSNYWICDGIIALADIDNAWQVGDILQGEIPLLNIGTRLSNDESAASSSRHLAWSAEQMPYCISTTTSSSGFVVSPSGVIPENTFEHSHRLGVLKLSRCTFNFSSPPFLCCHSLRFLWLEHCKDLLPRTSTVGHHQREAHKEEHELDSSATPSWACFQSLWVLDVRYTDCDQILSARMMDLMTQLRELNVMGAKNWDMSHLEGRLRNIRKLRVTKSTLCFSNNLFSAMESIELLDFSGNTIRQVMESLSGPSNNSSLKTVIIDGCDGLRWISFKGCKELKNLFLKGSLESLEELDLSGTKVKTLDLGGVKSTLPERIILLGCEKLRAILWPESVNEGILSNVLQIDTTSTSVSAEGGGAAHAHPYVDQSLQKQKQEKFKDGWQISLTDARLLRSLSPLRDYLSSANLHIDIYSPAIPGGSNGTHSDKPVQVQPHTSTITDCEYRDILKDGPVEVMMMWDCPDIRLFSLSSACIIKVMMHAQGNKVLEDAPGASTSDLLFPDFVFEQATSLHVYDSPSVTSIPAPPQGSGWKYLRWSRVERCPKIDIVFTLPQGSDVGKFFELETFWASQLLSARYIWDMSYGYSSSLKLLHVDHCPRLVHVLPLSTRQAGRYQPLQTLEIVYCGDLKEVFPLNPELEEEDEVLELPSLTGIHLHELPVLQHICRLRMRAPKLETVKIRGCWSLRRLPAVGPDTKPPQVDCEKEWWDNLEWDGLEKYHHPSLYKPSHSLYYKAQLPRVSVLR